MSQKPTFFILLFTLFLTQITLAQSDHILWFDKSASYFEESFVMGNGKMGASIFSGVHEEKIYLNDITLWAGEPVDPYMNPEAYKHIPEVREALRNEDYKLADELNKKIQGAYSQSYAPLGTLLIRFPHESEPNHYYRQLDINEAVSSCNYTTNATTFTREYFVSGPDSVIVIKLNANKRKALAFNLTFESLIKYRIINKQDHLLVDGYAPYHAEPNYRGDMEDALLYDENRGTHFGCLIQVLSSDGIVNYHSHGIEVKNASEAVILISTETSFNGFDKDPVKDGRDYLRILSTRQSAFKKHSYQRLKETHIVDYQSFFNRLTLSLGESSAPDLPINERLKRYAEGNEDKALEELYFQFGRYLLISSSRTSEIPANLQGLWNHHARPPWSSNYTMNINLEENYWLAESGNLSELHDPLLSFIENLATTGAVTAKTFYGVEKGWASCHNSDIWAMSNPVGDFGRGHPVWANWNMSAPWLCTHLWDHYLYSKDETFLREKAYPLMKGAAEFCLDWMIEDKNGKLITSPTTSPENIYLTPDGYKGATLYGATSDLAMIRELYLQTIRATELLETDEQFRKELQLALENFYPYQIGKKGNLQEWYHDWDDAHPQHRHQSHLYGLHPGMHIRPEQTPELAKACEKSLEIKGDESTGWSKGWRINLWARLKDGNHAYKMYRTLLRYVDPSGLDTQYSKGGGTYPNLLDAHPPFQIDGNFGGSAGVIEMLLQSSENEITLLPALPDAWDKGSINGVCARGGFELSISWERNELKEVMITARKPSQTTLKYKDWSRTISLKQGESMTINAF